MDDQDKIRYVNAFRANDPVRCPQCDWSGVIDDARQDFYDEMFVISCPQCETVLVVR